MDLGISKLRSNYKSMHAVTVIGIVCDKNMPISVYVADGALPPINSYSLASHLRRTVAHTRIRPLSVCFHFWFSSNSQWGDGFCECTIRTPYAGLYNQNPDKLRHGPGLIPRIPEGKGKYFEKEFVCNVNNQLSNFWLLTHYCCVSQARVDCSVSASALASKICSISKNTSIRYVLDSIFTRHTAICLRPPCARRSTCSCAGSEDDQREIYLLKTIQSGTARTWSDYWKKALSSWVAAVNVFLFTLTIWVAKLNWTV